MIYGITGNTRKDALWAPVASLVAWLQRCNLPFLLGANVAAGLVERGLVSAEVARSHGTPSLANKAHLILSFGGDGTLLRTAHDAGAQGTPILGINIGRMGFLAEVAVSRVEETVLSLEAGAYSIDERLVLAVAIEGEAVERRWALNDVVVARTGSAGLIALDVAADNILLNRYWADGLIVATPTGSTAYSLSAGGPIVAPGSDVIVLSPIAPHSLTVRPIVLSSDSVLTVRVTGGHLPYVVAIDGASGAPREDSVAITIRQAAHRINLVKLSDRHYFQTLRSKLSWGLGPQGGAESS